MIILIINYLNYVNINRIHFIKMLKLDILQNIIAFTGFYFVIYLKLRQGFNKSETLHNMQECKLV